MSEVPPDQRAQNVLNQLLQFPRHDWDRLLQKLCPSSPDVRQHVERMISDFDAAPGDLPDVPAVNFGVLDAESVPVTLGKTRANVAVKGGLPSFDDGFQLGNFRIIHVLGRGGFGIVYAAEEQLEDGKSRFVALKFVKEQGGLDQEIQTQSHFHHPNIVAVYGSASVEPWHFIVMELISPATEADEAAIRSSTSRTLAQEVSGTGMPFRRAAELTLQISDAVASAHSVRIVHLDIKPANVLLTKASDAKVSDFSLSAQISPDQKSVLPRGGTVGFAAPEQLYTQLEPGRLVDTRSDIFAIGATLYYMLTGQPIFRADHARGSLDSYLEFLRSDRAKIISPDHARPGVPGDLTTICSGCLYIDPRQRYQSAHELKLDLQRFLNHEPLAGASRTRQFLMAVRRNPVTAAALTMLIGIAVTLAIGVVRERNRFLLERNRFLGSSREAFGVTEDVLDSILDSTDQDELRRGLREKLLQRIPNLDDLVLLTPGEQKTMRALAKTHFFLGMEYFESDQFERALAEYDTALKLFDQIFEDRPDTALKWIERGGVYESWGTCLLAMGNATDARRNFKLALTNYGEADLRDPGLDTGTRVQSMLEDYTLFVVHEVSGWMALGRYHVAATVADEAIRLLEDDQRFAEETKRLYVRHLANERDAARNVPKALREPESAIDQPSEQQVAILTAVCRETARHESPLKGQVDLTIRAIQTLERAVELDPRITEGPHAQYNLACAYARAFQGARDVAPTLAMPFYERALSYLKEAIAEPQLANSAQNDEDLSSVVSTLGYVKLIQR